jgi:hypothetical protein
LIDDAFQCAFGKFGVIWNWDGDSSIPELFAENDVAAFLSYDRKPASAKSCKPHGLTMDAA